jgi:hypothetical protein
MSSMLKNAVNKPMRQADGGSRPLSSKPQESMLELSDDSDEDYRKRVNKRPLDDLSSDSEDEKPQKELLVPLDTKPVEELLKTRRPRYNKPLTDDLLLSVNGIEKVYNEFPLYLKSSSVTSGHEGAYLTTLLTYYKNWQFQIFPGASFSDFISKTDTLGSKSRIRSYMNRLRDKERDRYLVSFFLFHPCFFCYSSLLLCRTKC